MIDCGSLAIAPLSEICRPYSRISERLQRGADPEFGRRRPLAATAAKAKPSRAEVASGLPVAAQLLDQSTDPVYPSLAADDNRKRRGAVLFRTAFSNSRSPSEECRHERIRGRKEFGPLRKALLRRPKLTQIQ